MTNALDWTHSTISIPKDGLESHRTASPQQLATVAAALELIAIDRLEIRYRVTHMTRGRFRLTGKLQANVVQACVVTLDPVASELNEPLDVEFWPADAVAVALAPKPGVAEQEVFGDDPPEPIENGRIDIGRFVFETFAAALNPYPRILGAALDGSSNVEVGEPEPTAPHPFAALAKLKRTEN